LSAATARAATSVADTATSRARGRGRTFASVELSEDLDAAREAWAEIEAASLSSPYQSHAFAREWSQTLGASQGVTPMIVIAHDEAGVVVALLPLGRFRRGPLRLAAFLGDRWANFHMGLFRAGQEWTRGDIEALLDEAARKATPRIDAFVFISQPSEWRGAANPLAWLDRQPSPSFAFLSRLPESYTLWLDSHFSKASQKKLRKKAKKLEAFGPVTHARASGPAEARMLLDTLLAQKRERMRALGLDNAFEEPATIDFLSRISVSGTPALELHALLAGEKIVAVFGGFADRHRLYGLILSFDPDPAVAVCSPGELLVMDVVRHAINRGLSVFDLGVGEARYKSECCETTEALFDSAYAATFAGRIGAAAFLLSRRLKHRVKRSPRLRELARRLKRRFP